MTFNTQSEKYQYVNNMFGRIAHRYDRMNRVMTAGQDQRWRKLLIQQAQLPKNGTLLDIATGTGDIAFEAFSQNPDLDQVIAADYTLPMMQVGQQRVENLPNIKYKPLTWSGADALHLPFAANSFDAVVSGFLMRNVVDIGQALHEQYRVCKDGGRMLILEIPRPADNWYGNLFRLYFHNVVPVLGGLITGQSDAYQYLPASADAFLRPQELKQEMENIGFHHVSYQMLMFNTVALHVGIK